MTDYQPRRRRGRPPKAETPQANEATPATPKPTERRRRKMVGGFNLKLAAPEREGYIRRWVNDTPGRIANAEELAYEHVTEQGIKSDSPDSRVRRLVGTQASGAPLYAYLMETPREEFEHGIRDKEEAHAAFEASIKRGEDHLGGVQNSYGRGAIDNQTG